MLLFGGEINPGVATNRLYALDLTGSPSALADTGLPGGPFPAAWAAGANRQMRRGLPTPLRSSSNATNPSSDNAPSC